MKRILIFTFAAVAILALASAGLFAGPSCSAKKADASSKTGAKLTSANGANCDAHKAYCQGLSKEECKQLCDDVKAGKASFQSISVKGMTCGGCESKVTTALESTPGVLKVIKVSYQDGTALVLTDPAKASNDVITTAVSNTGFQAEIIPAVAKSTTASGKGASCSASSKKSCSASASKASAGGKGCCAAKGAKTTQTSTKETRSKAEGTN
ncbi:MAG: heavy-metal-associated domain-containing protein [Candidatus Zixiibacteriota bacterium]